MYINAPNRPHLLAGVRPPVKITFTLTLARCNTAADTESRRTYLVGKSLPTTELFACDATCACVFFSYYYYVFYRFDVYDIRPVDGPHE